MTDVRARDRTAAGWEELYISLRPELFRSLVAVIGSYDGVEDAIQEAFAKGMHTRLEGVANVEAWLFTVALNSLRRSRRRARLFTPFMRDRAGTSHELDVVIDQSDAITALRSLPERERTLLVGKYYVGLTQDELARITGFSRGTISSALSRASTLLREREEARR